MPDEPMENLADLPNIIERLSPSSLAAHIDPSRPYGGRPNRAMDGYREGAEIRGITMRDLRDAFIRACYESSGLPIEQWPGSVYGLPWDRMDIIAVAQNLAVNVEKAMGIYPNCPRLYPADPTEPHWCGEHIDVAEWTSHEGRCP